jgi:hypothetical protein
MMVEGPIDIDAFFRIISIGAASYPAWVFLIIGFVFIYTFCGLFGAVAGFIFAKFVNRVPVRSTYIKSVAFGVVLVVFFSILAHWSLARAIVPLAISPVYAVIFAYLFKQWTRIAKSGKP